MTSYYRVMLGAKSKHAADCFVGHFIGTDFLIHEDLSESLTEEWRAFNRRYAPVYLSEHPGKSKIAAGLACGALWTVSKGIQSGDVVLCPDGRGGGMYMIGEVVGDYYYAPGNVLPHRRRVHWRERAVLRKDMTQALRYSSGAAGTVSNISQYRVELEALIEGHGPQIQAQVAANNAEIEDPVAFAMEKHLEAFLVANWNQTLLSQDFNVYEEDGELVGQQYPTDAGPIDILAISKDKKRLLVVELKRGRASDVVVGQILRYMGFLRDQVAEDGQTVEGIIIALEDDQKLRWALMAVPAIEFYRYQLSFKLMKG